MFALYHYPNENRKKKNVKKEKQNEVKKNPENRAKANWDALKNCFIFASVKIDREKERAHQIHITIWCTKREKRAYLHIFYRFECMLERATVTTSHTLKIAETLPFPCYEFLIFSFASTLAHQIS